MRWWLLAGMFGVGGGLFFTLASGAAQEAPDQAKKNEDFYKGRSALGRRANGVRLQLAASVQPAFKGDELRLDWSLDYEGPRPPLIILEPSLEKYTSGQTAAIFYAEGKDQRPYEYVLPSPTSDGGPLVGPLSPKESFLTMPKGKKTSGTTMVPVAKLRAFYAKRWPDQFGATAPVVQVQLRHKPFDRGVGFDLDAWTGEVYTPLVKVPLEKW